MTVSDQPSAGADTSTATAPAATKPPTNKPTAAEPKATRSMPKRKPGVVKKPALKPSKGPHRHSKTEQALALLRRPSGCTLAELMKITKWQQHSVRGFLSGTVKKRLGLKLTSEPGDKGRRYKVSGPSRGK